MYISIIVLEGRARQEVDVRGEQDAVKLTLSLLVF